MLNTMNTYERIALSKPRRRASVPDYARIAAQVNSIAAAAGHRRGLTVSDVQAIFAHFEWRCSECQERHSSDNPVSLIHTFKLGAGRCGRHNTSNMKTICKKCERKEDPSDYQNAILTTSWQSLPCAA